MNGQTAVVIVVAILAIPLSVFIIEYFHRRDGRHTLLHSGAVHGDRYIIVPAEVRSHHWLWPLGYPFGHTHPWEDDDVVTNDVLTNELAGHVAQDHGNLATAQQLGALQAQVDRQGRQIRALMRQNRRLRIRISSQFPWEVIGFFVGAIVGLVVDAFLPKHFYHFNSVTNVFVSGKLVRIDHVTNTDQLKLWGIIFAFAMLGFVIGLILKYVLGRTRQIEVEEPPAEQADLVQAEQP